MKKVVEAACLLLPTLCFASNWVKVGSGMDSRTFVDTQSIRVAGKGIIEASVFWSYATPQTSRVSSASPQYLSSRIRELFRCAEGTSATIGKIEFKTPSSMGDTGGTWSIPQMGARVTNAVPHGIDTSATWSIPQSQASFTDVVPGSIGETTLQFVCARVPKEAESRR
ncbi:surface-adhesin E family protein [Pandoraea terrae]|uniref:surface-adhesin E family protein n=1 Tax=Pandoraea terrae TaxID=1537710 RepID=UPI0012409FA8|nr:surface-adhesin E family protein [Pandoraea terrae]